MPQAWSSGSRLPPEQGVGNVEEGEPTNNAGAQEVELQAGGAFWVNSLGNSSGAEECQGQCSGVSQKAKKAIRPDNSWRRQLFPEDVRTPTSNRFAALTEDQAKEESSCSILAVEKGHEEIEGKLFIIDSGAADSVMPKEILGNAFPLMSKKEGLRFLAANGKRS